MSELLHLETGQVHNCAWMLREHSGLARQQARVLRISARSMEWTGPARDAFHDELERLAVALDQMAEHGSMLSHQVYQSVDRWYELDQYFAKQYSALFLILDRIKTNLPIITK